MRLCADCRASWTISKARCGCASPASRPALLVARGHPRPTRSWIDVQQQLAILGDGVHRRWVIGAATAGDDTRIDDTEVHVNEASRLVAAQHLDAKWCFGNRVRLRQTGLQQRMQGGVMRSERLDLVDQGRTERRAPPNRGRSRQGQRRFICCQCGGRRGGRQGQYPTKAKTKPPI